MHICLLNYQCFFGYSIVKFDVSIFAITNKGYVRYAFYRHASRHGLTTAMQHLVVTGKVLRGLSD